MDFRVSSTTTTYTTMKPVKVLSGTAMKLWTNIIGFHIATVLIVSLINKTYFT